MNRSYWMTDEHDFVQVFFFYTIIYQEHSKVAEHKQCKDFQCLNDIC